MQIAEQRDGRSHAPDDIEPLPQPPWKPLYLWTSSYMRSEILKKCKTTSDLE